MISRDDIDNLFETFIRNQFSKAHESRFMKEFLKLNLERFPKTKQALYDHEWGKHDLHL